MRPICNTTPPPQRSWMSCTSLSVAKLYTKDGPIVQLQPPDTGPING
jgi:hypothetical protein